MCDVAWVCLSAYVALLYFERLENLVHPLASKCAPIPQEAMDQRLCAHPGCTNVASGKCIMRPDKFCGSHCGCPGHSRRLMRSGASRRGRPSDLTRRLIDMRQLLQRELDDSVTHLLRHEERMCRAFNIFERTGARRYVIAVFVARLSWDSIQVEHRACTAVMWTMLSETLGATRTARLLDCIRREFTPECLSAIGQHVASIWSRASALRLEGLTLQSVETSTRRERSPVPLPTGHVEQQMSQVPFGVVSVSG